MSEKGTGDNRYGIPEPFYSEHKKCSANRESLLQSAVCGCFYCCEVFNPADIIKWVDNQSTAVCPLCGIDSVLAAVNDKEFLKKMHYHWFAIG